MYKLSHLLILSFIFVSDQVRAESLGSFQGELIYKGVAGQERVVEMVTPFAFEDPNGKLWTVPGGARVNGASIPQAFWSVIGGPFTGKYRDASVIHDYFCDTKTETWQDTHRVFYDGMRANGVDAVTANTMYAAVYWGGPRWVNIAGANAVSGQPMRLRKKPADIVALASKPGLTPEEIRGEIDKLLDVGSTLSARDKLAGQPDCSLVVNSTGNDVNSFGLCDLDSESRRLLARRNLKILTADIDTLLSANDTLLLPKIDAYIDNPAPETWKLVDVASRKVLRLVALTMISLNQAKAGLGGSAATIETTQYDPKKYQQSLDTVAQIGATRSAMLKKNITDVPRTPQALKIWKAVYLELLKRLRGELPKLMTALE